MSDVAPLRLADLAMFERLGIPPELLEQAGVVRVTDAQARALLSSRHSGDLAGVVYPYHDPAAGARLTCRVRRDHPEIENGKPRDKYLSAFGDSKHLFFPPGAGELLADTSASIIIVEAEKSVLAIMAAAERTGRRVLAMGTGGCWGWRGRIGKTTDATGARVDEKGPLPDLNRVTWLDRDVVILFDAHAATNTSVQAARRKLAEDLAGRGARVRIAELPVEDGINGPDDFVGQHGDAVLFALIDGARPMHPTSAAEVLRLAELDNIHGVTLADLERRFRRLKDGLQGADAIRRRTVREMLVSALKAEKISGAAALADAAIGGLDETEEPAADFLADEVPWPDRVEGAALLDALVETVTHHVVLSRHAAQAIVLWVVLTYFDAVVNLLPLLLVTSPTKRCGKTKTVEVVGGLACRALPVSNITAAALYRAIDRFHPTLLLDESDTFINDDPELRGVINAGHTRHTARVIRCVGDNSEPTIFSTWCPKLVAMIGLPKDTLIDRSIIIRLERKAAGETVERLRAEQVHLVFADLRRQIRRWADDHLDDMRAADPTMPNGLHDRAVDNYRPLIAIAELAGGAWPALARQAVIELAGYDGDENPLGEELLADLRGIFEDTDTLFADSTRDAITTAKVTDLLVALDSKPWATYAKSGKPISQHQVARLLKRFAVRPTKVKAAGKSLNCYRRRDLEPAWKRYCPGAQVGTSEPANDSGPESTVAGRNPHSNGSDLKTAVSPMNTGTVPRFRPENPSVERERVEL